jgi:hypothetical protein
MVASQGCAGLRRGGLSTTGPVVRGNRSRVESGQLVFQRLYQCADVQAGSRVTIHMCQLCGHQLQL